MSTPAHRYLVALGSNLGERLKVLHHARVAIAADIGTVTAHASYYATKPIGAADQPFINSALIVTTEIAPEVMLKALLGIESRLGRVRRERWGNRLIDLDILLWQGWEGGAWRSREWHADALHIPHPQLLLRDFALVPAAEIAGDWWHQAGATTLSAAAAAASFQLTAMEPG